MSENKLKSETSTLTILTQEIDAAKLILKQMTKLTASGGSDAAINEMLAVIGSYTRSERSYIFEKKGALYSNTHEWCREGVRPEMDSLQNLTAEVIGHLTCILEKGESIFIPDIESIRETQPKLYALLERQNITSIILAPIMMEKRLMGFLGVDNVPHEITELISNSLSTLGTLLGVIIQNHQEQETVKKQNNELKQERKMFRDALSNNCAYCYFFDVTDNLIREKFLTSHSKDILAELGFSLPVSFDDLNRKYIKEHKVTFLHEDISPYYTCQGLLEQYNKGVTNVISEYHDGLLDVYIRVSTLLSKDESTGHIHAVVLATDITKAKKKEALSLKQLMESETKLKALNGELQTALKSEKEKNAIIGAIANIYYCCYLIDVKKKNISEITSIHSLKKFFRFPDSAQASFEAWIDSDIDEAFHKKAKAFTDLNTLPGRMRDKDVLNLDCISKEFGWVRVSFIAAGRDKDDNVLQVIWVAQHIDAEKQNELSQQTALKAAFDAANRANSAKTSFLASMSHDIRTPMNAIIGMTAIAGTHLDDKERVADCLSKITISSKHLLGLINEVLDMSKIESGRIDLHDEEFGLPELIDNLLSMIKPQIKAKNHDLSVSIRNIVHEKVIGDSQRIQQAFMNLMGNAIKYTPEGGKIRLSISEKPTNKLKVGCYEFIFEDNGIGMSEDFLSHLFEPFSRATDERVNNIQGTGLGMAITKNMVQMMNGNIKVESKLNEGTKITVTIVLKLQNPNEEIAYEEFLNLPILVVDDDAISCESACVILDELGMKGEWVLSGHEAVDLVIARHEEEKDFFAVIIDWKMPDMDGIATTKEIRRRVGNDVPIIIISAYDWSDIELEARAAGANAFISKPLFKSRMAHVFNNLLGHERREEADLSLSEIVQRDFTGKRALLVEDNDLNAEIAGEILGMAGLTVNYAKDGKEALDIMSSVSDNYYDIVFMDIQMPVMNGYDATTAIRSLPRDYTKRVPIIAMTANAFTEDVNAAMASGMNQHMAKPLDFNVLMSTLQRWLT